jgi:hypothetical protein
MPTYEVFEDWSGRPVSADARTGRKFRRLITVRTSDPVFTWIGEAVNAVGAVGGIYLGMPHPEWPTARCVRIGDADSHPDDPSLAIVPVDYEEAAPVPGQVYGISPPPPGVPPPPGQNPGNPPEPESRSPFPKVQFREVPYYKRRDLNDEEFKNSAGDLLEDVPALVKNNGLLRWTVWKPTWSFALGMAINGKVNLYDWEGFPEYTLKVTIENAEPITERGRTVWKIDYLIEYDEDGWVPTEVLDAGRRAKNASGAWVIEESNKGIASRELILLNGAGQKTTTPNYLYFTLREAIDFSIL